MGLQVIHNSDGKETGVYIPIKEWRKLKKQYHELESLEYSEPDKEQILDELKQAVGELKLIVAGKAKAIPIDEFLNGL